MVKCLKDKSLYIIIIICAIMNMSLDSVCGRLQRFHHHINKNGTLNFLVVGDWGRKGWYNQSQVALQMAMIGEKVGIDFVVSTGDNFYEDGLIDSYDPAFQLSFKYVYAAPTLQKQWYSVLGNHDYRGDVEAQLDPLLRMIDRRWLCLRSFIVNADVAELFMVDTTPFVNMYFEDPKDHKYDWRGILPRRRAYLSNLLMELRRALKESKAKWKIVVGHHGIRTTGPHGDTHELVTHLLPLLQEHGVDFYLNGHDHCLEHVGCPDSKIQFITSGGGSKAWLRRGKKKHKKCGVKFYHAGQGFGLMQLTKDDANLVFYDVYGHPLHHYSTSSNNLHSSI